MWKKISGYIGLGFSGHLFMGCVIASIISAIGTLLVFYIVVFDDQGPEVHDFTSRDVLIFLLATLIFAALSWTFWRVLAKQKKKVRNLSSVQIVDSDKLVDNETLVRASTEPCSVQSEVLLRAANEGTTPKEELLRAQQNE